MSSDIPRDLRRVVFFKNRDGTRGKDASGNLLVDALGMPKRHEVSPIWAMVGPEGNKADGEILPRYQEAAISLATSPFFKRTWDSDFDGAKFFMIRDRWIEACEAARAHDWDVDLRHAEFRRSMDERAAEVGRSTRRFRNAIAMDRQWGAQKLAFFLWAAFENRDVGDDEAGKMMSSVPTDAILCALDRFAEHCETPLGRGSGSIPFGPVHFLKLPRRLTASMVEVALALELADLFSCWRAYTPKVLPLAGRTPSLTSGTPWKPLTHFVDAAFGNEGSTPGLQKRAEAMAVNVVIWGLPSR
ncbi:hypothetical protein GCM10011371_10140 [Novosphingobium marinum]|uniref:Uncharacterized protein n=1 Tax=Novosphingobium marinum TaxID=1514948 RepID=A0A7Z0BSN3_9SPHN|nr:hypothetical protein [Novosphingobium marinum]NYH95121.1 hypothetical protein [Novosphingobium marinum]GGC24476.1 hypothetical protein GCM10011371_10140 [Novosphingobium marinum]